MDSADRPLGVTSEEWQKHLEEQAKAERRAFNEKEEARREQERFNQRWFSTPTPNEPFMTERERDARARAERALGFKMNDPSDAGGWANGQRFRPVHPLERRLVFRLQAAEMVRLDPPHKNAPPEEHEAWEENQTCDMIFFNGDIKQALSHMSPASPYDERLLCELAARITRQFEKELQKHLRAYMAETRTGSYGSFADRHTGWETNPYEQHEGKAGTGEGGRALPDGTRTGHQPGVEGDGGVRRGSDGSDGRERQEG